MPPRHDIILKQEQSSMRLVCPFNPLGHLRVNFKTLNWGVKVRPHTDWDCLDMHTFCPAPVLYLVLGLFQCPKHGLELEVYWTQLSVLLHMVMLMKSFLVFSDWYGVWYMVYRLVYIDWVIKSRILNSQRHGICPKAPPKNTTLLKFTSDMKKTKYTKEKANIVSIHLKNKIQLHIIYKKSILSIKIQIKNNDKYGERWIILTLI